MHAGILSVIKPPGMTSSDVVAVVRRLTGQRRVGHTGTLDPNAAGVLPLCLGRATRFIDYMNHDKAYLAELCLGISTDTQDGDGRVLFCRPVTATRQEVEGACRACIGEQKQIPPMVSALRVKGRRLYQYAREGIEVERKARTIRVYDMDCQPTGHPARYRLTVSCGGGTYVRTLCADIGEGLGCGGHMGFLLRIRSGIYGLEDSVLLSEIDGDTPLRPVEEALEHLSVLEVPSLHWRAFCNGVAVETAARAGMYRVYHDGFQGVGCAGEDGRLRMKVWLDKPGEKS